MDNFVNGGQARTDWGASIKVDHGPIHHFPIRHFQNGGPIHDQFCMLVGGGGGLVRHLQNRLFLTCMAFPPDNVSVSGFEAGLAVFICAHRVVLGSFVFVFRLSLLSLLYSCAHRWVPVSFPFTCACWGIARWVLLLLLLFSGYSFRFFCQFGFPCDDVASCRLEFCKSRLPVCAVCRSLGPGEYM